MTRLTKDELDEISRTTLEHYDCNARAFWEGTRDHDVSQNIEEIRHYYRPSGLPREQQRWLASLWRRPAEP